MTPTPPHAQARENADPVERTHPIPLSIAALTTLLVLFGAGYLLFSESFGPSELGDRRTLADLSGPVATTASNAGANGQQLFATHCMACHQANGQGLPVCFRPWQGLNGSRAMHAFWRTSCFLALMARSTWQANPSKVKCLRFHT